MFKKNFERICSEKGLSPTSVCVAVGLSNSMYSEWNEKSVPRKTTLLKLADYLNVPMEALTAEDVVLTVLPQSNVHMIPLFESVSAGFGAYADSTILEYVPLYIESPTEAAETICIKVKGNSMAPKIEDGDIIQIRKQTSVDSGSIAVVLLGGEEGLVKKVNYGKTWIELISLNEKYPPLRFEGEDVTKIQVVGLVKKIIKEV